MRRPTLRGFQTSTRGLGSAGSKGRRSSQYEENTRGHLVEEDLVEDLEPSEADPWPDTSDLDS